LATGSAPWHLGTFSDDGGSDGKHRVGWVVSNASRGAPLAASWDEYSPSHLPLGDAPGGEIDSHLFRDPVDGAVYLLWKSDDNNVGANATRLGAQRVNASARGLLLLGPRTLLLNSSALWWAPSFVEGGTLIEAPELIYEPTAQWYYLFFAAGRFCRPSYSEGVARSRHVLGPYEVLPVPLLSTGLLGAAWGGTPLVGPGHAAFARTTSTAVRNAEMRNGAHGDERGAASEWYVVFHASPSNTCNRWAFVERMRFSSEGWPYVDWTRCPSDGLACKGPSMPSPRRDRTAPLADDEPHLCRIVAPCRRLDTKLAALVDASRNRTCSGRPVARIGLPFGDLRTEEDIASVCHL